MAAPEDRFKPDQSASLLPSTSPPPNTLQVQQAGTSREPKNAFEDPNSEKFIIEFWSGAGSRQLIMAAPNKESAMLGAYCVATRITEIHTFGVWRKTGPELTDIGECVCYVPIANMVASCAKALEPLTGKRILSPAVPLQTIEAGFDELARQVKEQRRRS